MERFFISGCQRSGTTLLRLVLESHPSIQCFDEAIGYEILISESRGLRKEYLRKAGATLLGFKIPRFAEQLTWPEFSDPDYGRFPSFYKRQKIIHIIRDVLDVVASMMKLRMHDGDSWLDRYGRTILAELVEHPNVNSECRRKYRDLERQGLPIHLVGALYWEIKNQGLIDSFESKNPIYALKYESLVASPEVELRSLTQFLGIDWHGAVLNHPNYDHGELDERGVAIGETDSRRRIDVRSVGGYQRVMTNEQIEDVKLYVANFSQTLAAVVL